MFEDFGTTIGSGLQVRREEMLDDAFSYAVKNATQGNLLTPNSSASVVSEHSRGS